MMIKKVLAALMAAALVLAFQPAPAHADDWYSEGGGYYTVQTQDGQVLFSYAGQISVDDEYISGENKRYRVTQVDDANRIATATYVEDVVLWAGYDPSMVQTVAAQGQKKVAMYCTHTDESYDKGDGASAKPEDGGVLDVAKTLSDKLKSKGIDAVVDTTPHDPHDAGAYRRSRSSAMNLMESVQPDLLLDIHRDGVPNPKEYDKDVNGQAASKVRFVVGRSNQNKAANEDTAKKLKQVADTAYPGLIKDIFIGKGSYNQDLTPNSLIMEFGTNTVDKNRVLQSTNYIADTVSKYLGATGGGAQQGAQPGQGQQPQQQSAQQQQQPSQNRTAAKSIGWVVGIVAAVALVFLFVAVSRGNRKDRAGDFVREITGIGNKDEDGDKDRK